jgi:DNA-binding response OmpR family regulator
MHCPVPTALVVEDDPQVRLLLYKMLTSEGFEVSSASRWADAKRAVKDQRPRIVLLDLGLPGGDGLELGKWIRTNFPSIGILVLTGRTAIKDRIAGLTACADDYVTKPFDAAEVKARVHNILRRLEAAPSTSSDMTQPVSFEGWILGEDNCALTAGNDRVKLTAMEFKLLKALVDKQGKVATRAWLLDQINADADITERTVDYHVCTLRLKLQKAGVRGGAIASVRGVGYRYAPSSARPANDTGPPP